MKPYVARRRADMTSGDSAKKKALIPKKCHAGRGGSVYPTAGAMCTRNLLSAKPRNRRLSYFLKYGMAWRHVAYVSEAEAVWYGIEGASDYVPHPAGRNFAALHRTR